MKIKDILTHGIKITFSTGKPFDPATQKRTDPIRDIIEKQKRNKKKEG